MRLFVGLFSLPLILLLLLNASVVSAKIGPSCLKVVLALAGRPSELFEKFQREICDQGCQPTVPHWDLWTRNNTFVPAVRNMMKRLDAPRQEDVMLKLGDDAADIIKSRCGPKLQGRDICSDDETLAAFGNCFKTNFLRAAMKNLPSLLPLVSEEVCREQHEWLQKDQLWDEIIPNNMRAYASVCKTLGDGVQVMDGMIMRAGILLATTSILAITSSATYDISPETFEGSYKDLGLPTIYDLASTQLGNLNGSRATNSWITGTNGEQYFITTLYTSYGMDGVQDVFRGSILELTSMEYHYTFQAGKGSNQVDPAGRFKVGLNDGWFEAISEDNYGIMGVHSLDANATFNLTYHATSKPLINGGTGVVMFGGSEMGEWALPACKTEGFLVVNGEQVTVDPAHSLTWYDRGLGTGGFTNWTWYGLLMPQTGDMISLWAGDTQEVETSQRFASIRSASGGQTVCGATFTPDFSHVWPGAAGKSFPLAWTVQIPCVDADFKVEAVTENQLNLGSIPS
ncbi:hypothetical protein FE257_000398, partial [Aspergillus nanangensis]